VFDEKTLLITLEDSAKVRVALDLDIDAAVSLWFETVNS
jgi:hypothetical protein